MHGNAAYNVQQLHTITAYNVILVRARRDLSTYDQRRVQAVKFRITCRRQVIYIYIYIDRSTDASVWRL